MNSKIILYEIAQRMKSVDDRISISSMQFAELLDVSQQTASRYLKNLEHENLIKRKIGARGQEIELTGIGIKILNEFYLNLRDFFENKKDKKEIFEGRVIKGIGEGAYYVKEYRGKINEKLNFMPFEGTLNIKLNENFIDFNFDRFVPVFIDFFKKGGRTFGKVKCIPAKLMVKGKKNEKEVVKEIKENCFIIIPERTHHEDVVEIISEFNLREKLGLFEGSRVRVELNGF